MDARFYNSEEIDIQKLATDFENIFRAQGHETQQIATSDQIMIQLKKGGDLAALVGLQTALSVTIQRTTGGVVSMLGQQKWIDKAAVGAVGLVAAPFIPILLPLVATAGVGAIKQANLANQVMNTIDGLIRQQVPGAQAGPLPVSLLSQFPQFASQYTPPSPVTVYTPVTPVYTPPPSVPVYTPPPVVPVYTPPAVKPRCPTCNTPYEPGDTFCSGCGRGLTPPKNLCPACKTEVKPGVTFCPKCGESLFQGTQNQPARSSATSTSAPSAPTVAGSAPTISRPPVPTYTPPSRPPTPVYTPPPARPPVPTYTPPQQQSEPVIPQPSITLIPGKPKPATPTPPPAPKVPVYVPPKAVEPPAPVYIPPKQDLEPTIAAAPPAPTIKAKPASETGIDGRASWGVLIFDNGTEIDLLGERVQVGRYDHDLEGVQPEVDLGTMEGADTVSRGHATFEHIGSTYQLTDLNSTNFTRVNGKRLDANVPSPINDGDTIQFGKISCTFKKN